MTLHMVYQWFISQSMVVYTAAKHYTSAHIPQSGLCNSCSPNTHTDACMQNTLTCIHTDAEVCTYLLPYFYIRSSQVPCIHLLHSSASFFSIGKLKHRKSDVLKVTIWNQTNLNLEVATYSSLYTDCYYNLNLNLVIFWLLAEE